MPEKEKQWKRNFLIILFYFYQSKHFVCFFNYHSWKCGQLTHNYIKRDLGDSNFSFATIVIPIVISRITVVHLKNLFTYTYS